MQGIHTGTSSDSEVAIFTRKQLQIDKLQFILWVQYTCIADSFNAIYAREQRQINIACDICISAISDSWNAALYKGNIGAVRMRAAFIFIRRSSGSIEMQLARYTEWDLCARRRHFRASIVNHSLWNKEPTRTYSDGQTRPTDDGQKCNLLSQEIA